MNMIPDNMAERANHLQHCRNKVADWAMRNVLDYLLSHCANVAEYRDGDSTETMDIIDADNREAAARYMAGDPQLASIGSMFSANRVAMARALPALAPHHSPTEHARAASKLAADIGGAQ